MLRQLIAPFLLWLWEHDAALTVKERVLRPCKQFIFGKGDIYYVVDVVTRARGGRNPVKAVLDVGAAVGDKTRTFLRIFPGATVYCFEPQSQARERLARRVRPWKERVRIFGVALFNENRSGALRLYSHRDASSILTIPHFLEQQGKTEIGVESITLRRLDDCLSSLGVSRIDFMKIDVEGAEREVLEGASAALRVTDNVYVEISPLRKDVGSRDHIEIFQLLHDAGFTFIGQYGDFWFSKDPAVLAALFGERRSDARARKESLQ